MNPHDLNEQAQSGQVVAYRDFSSVDHEGSSFKPKVMKVSDSPKKRQINFPEKLHYVLSELAKDGLDGIVAWQPHGRCFVVRDQKRFEKEVVPL